MKIKQYKVAIFISLLADVVYLISSMIFYRILKIDMPISLYIILAFFIGLSDIIGLFHIKFDENISPKYKLWFYINRVTFVLLTLHFLISADRKQRIIKDFNWAAMFVPDWKIFFPLGVIIGVLIIGSKIYYDSFFFPICDVYKRTILFITERLNRFRKNSRRNQ